MNRDVRITRIQVTPVAFRDAPLLNAAGIHEPWALRSIVEIESTDGRVGLSETYGEASMLAALAEAKPHVLGLSPFDLNRMQERLVAAIQPEASGADFSGAAYQSSKLAAKVVGAFEVAMMDLQGQILNAPVVDLLGGTVRSEVAYSAYLFFKYAEHHGRPYEPDPWGKAITPKEIVAQAQRMIDLHGFESIKLKGGVFEPAHEIACIRALREAFPTLPLRLDPNANWSLETSKEAARELDDLLEYYEDPCAGLENMAELAQHVKRPLATNMVVTSFEEFRRNVTHRGAQIILSDHHFWGGLRASQQLARMCALWDIGVSMHSNSHLGISLTAMTHVAAAIPNLRYAGDTHYPWQDEDLLAGGRIRFRDGKVSVPTGAGLGIQIDREQLARLHEQYLRCGMRKRDDRKQMQKYDPSFTGATPRF